MPQLERDNTIENSERRQQVVAWIQDTLKPVAATVDVGETLPTDALNITSSKT